jgi:hypothetical protein
LKPAASKINLRDTKSGVEVRKSVIRQVSELLVG